MSLLALFRPRSENQAGPIVPPRLIPVSCLEGGVLTATTCTDGGVLTTVSCSDGGVLSVPSITDGGVLSVPSNDSTTLTAVTCD